MSLAVIQSRALTGMDAAPVAVEVHLAAGLPTFTLVGLAEAEVREARDRVRAAIQNSGFEFPARRITVNLAPADLPKVSAHFDLPIAVGILLASGQLPCRGAQAGTAMALDDHEFAGELSLSGALRPIRGALAMGLAAKRRNAVFVCPAESGAEAALVDDLCVFAALSLNAVCAHLVGREVMPRAMADVQTVMHAYPDLCDVKGQAQAKRALEVAAAGNHSLLMSGPPGTGKSMLAARLPGLLPPLPDDLAYEAAAVQSLAGQFVASRWRQRPFRAPHHSASAPALVGGGSTPRPGEISLAHGGVLFLDELPEFDRRVLEALREPLESGTICVSRAARRAEFPARFQLVAAMNPCPCGYLGHGNGRCRCTPDQVARYRGKLSGPLLDRMDLMVEVPAVSETELRATAEGEGSASVRQRVLVALQRQIERQGCANAHLTASGVDSQCQALADERALALLGQAMSKLGLSARAYHRILKVARTIADLAGSTTIQVAHVAEAIQYRRGLVSA